MYFRYHAAVIGAAKQESRIGTWKYRWDYSAVFTPFHINGMPSSLSRPPLRFRSTDPFELLDERRHAFNDRRAVRGRYRHRICCTPHTHSHATPITHQRYTGRSGGGCVVSSLTRGRESLLQLRRIGDKHLLIALPFVMQPLLPLLLVS